MGRESLVREFLAFVRHQKKWWIAPLLLILLLAASLILFAGSSPLAPFLYPMF